MNDKDKRSGKAGSWHKMIALAAVVAAVGLLYVTFGPYLRLDYLAGQEAQLKALQARSPPLVFGIACLIYVTVTGLSLPGAALLTLVMGWYFGFWRALVLVSIASTTGATIAFLLKSSLLPRCYRITIRQSFEIVQRSAPARGCLLSVHAAADSCSAVLRN